MMAQQTAVLDEEGGGKTTEGKLLLRKKASLGSSKLEVVIK